MVKTTNTVMKRILIQTVTGIYKHINLKMATFNKKYAFQRKLPKDKRRNVYKKKAIFYEKENRALNLRRLKKRDKTEYQRAIKYKTYKEYIQAKEEQEDRRKEKQIKLFRESEEEKKKKLAKAEKAHIRIWMKLKYTGDNPLFIESYIEGKAGEEGTLKATLQSFIASNFGEEISSLGEIGIERIKKVSTRAPQVNYKHNLTGGWSKF